MRRSDGKADEKEPLTSECSRLTSFTENFFLEGRRAFLITQ